MKLKIHLVPQLELQDYLDHYQERIKFVCLSNASTGLNMFVVIIDEA